uniref:Uncharacterized protein n=1 Tax=Leishmania mexicana mexicana TaxID=44270 RepID=O76239_LEIME|nr:unknown [Leishmania mexicana mexicana]
MALWGRYRSVRATYPYSTLELPSLDAIDIDFLADVVQSSENTGSSSNEVGMGLLQAALWSLHTVVTGVCPHYHYVPAPSAPQLWHLRSAAGHEKRTNARICLPSATMDSQPLTPLETYVALMPTEATLPKSIAAGLHSKAAHQSILKTLATSNDTAAIARAAKEAVEVSAPWLTKSEQYLRHFTSPVQLNVNPPRRRLSRHEATSHAGDARLPPGQGPVPKVESICDAGKVGPFLNVPYLPYRNTLILLSIRVATEQPQEGDEGDQPPLHTTLVAAPLWMAGGSRTCTDEPYPPAPFFFQQPSLPRTECILAVAPTAPQELAQMGLRGPQAGRQSIGECTSTRRRLPRSCGNASASFAAAKLQRALDITSGILERGQHFTTPQQRRMQRRLHRLRQVESADVRAILAREDRKYVSRTGKTDTRDLESELRHFLGDDASPEEVAALMGDAADEHADVGVAVRGAGVVASSGKASTRKKNLNPRKRHFRGGGAASTTCSGEPAEGVKGRRQHDGSRTNAGHYEYDMTASTVTVKQRKRRAAVSTDVDSHADVDKTSAGLKRRRRERIEGCEEDSVLQRTPTETKKRRRV